MLAKIDPTIYRAQYDQAVAKKAQDEAHARQCRVDLDRYTKLGRTNAVTATAVRHPEGAGRSARSADAVRPGAHRQRQGDAGLHQDRRADRRPHRHPPGRRRQYRARRPTPPASWSSRRSGRSRSSSRLPQQELPAVNQAFARGARRRSRPWRTTTSTVIDHGKPVVVDNQVDQTTGTVQAQGRVPQPGPAAVARASSLTCGS